MVWLSLKKVTQMRTERYCYGPVEAKKISGWKRGQRLLLRNCWQPTGAMTRSIDIRWDNQRALVRWLIETGTRTKNRGRGSRKKLAWKNWRRDVEITGEGQTWRRLHDLQGRVRATILYRLFSGRPLTIQVTLKARRGTMIPYTNVHAHGKRALIELKPTSGGRNNFQALYSVPYSFLLWSWMPQRAMFKGTDHSLQRSTYYLQYFIPRKFTLLLLRVQWTHFIAEELFQRILMVTSWRSVVLWSALTDITAKLHPAGRTALQSSETQVRRCHSAHKLAVPVRSAQMRIYPRTSKLASSRTFKDRATNCSGQTQWRSFVFLCI